MRNIESDPASNRVRKVENTSCGGPVTLINSFQLSVSLSPPLFLSSRVENDVAGRVEVLRRSYRKVFFFFPPPSSVFVPPLEGSRRLLRFVIIPRDPVDTARPRVKSDATTSRVEHFFLLASYPRPYPIVNHAYQRIRPITSLLRPHIKSIETGIASPRFKLYYRRLIQCVS